MARFAAIDLGASSGRVMVGEVGPSSLVLEAAARFANDPVRTSTGLHWDVTELFRQALSGVAAAHRAAPLDSVGVDTWAVDYGLLRDGRLLAEPWHYRDQRRNQVGPDAVHRLISAPDLYRRNGLQFLPFNTLYQLAADEQLTDADRLLMIPDLIAFWLTGQQHAERTNASTTGLLNVTTGDWDAELLSRMSVPRKALADLITAGTTIGPLMPSVAEQIGAALPVVAVGSHDTASAVVGVPMQTDDAAYISLGTWGLVGLELDRPVLTEESRLANFTNEGGVDGRVRFLTNVMGTFLLSETLRTWAGRGEPADLPDLLRAAAEVTAPPCIFDVQDARFVPPGDMPARIEAWCHEHDQQPPRGPVETVRSIVESVAVALARALGQAQSLTGRTVGTVHVVGGGSRNELLCQVIADRSGKQVLAGPVEATAIGNVLVQARTAGAVGARLEDLRELVARTHQLVAFAPRD